VRHRAGLERADRTPMAARGCRELVPRQATFGVRTSARSGIMRRSSSGLPMRRHHRYVSFALARPRYSTRPQRRGDDHGC
jgi:hypothetical protein